MSPDKFDSDKIKIISNRSGQELCSLVIDEFSKRLAVPERTGFIGNQKNAEAKVFNSGEVFTQVNTNARIKHIHLIGAFHDPDLYFARKAVVNSNLSEHRKIEQISEYLHTAEKDFRELTKICDAVKRSGPHWLFIYLPYFIDGRQDRKQQSRVPISAKLTFLEIEAAAGRTLKRFGTVELHASQIQGMTELPVDEIQCAPLFITHLKYSLGTLENVVLIFPDEGSIKRYQSLIEKYDFQYAIVPKERPSHSVSRVKHYIGDSPKGKIGVLLDDIIDTSGTLIGAGEKAYGLGAKEIMAYCASGLFSANIKKDSGGHQKRIVFPEAMLKKSGIKVVCSDAIPRNSKYLHDNRDWLTQFTLAPYLADLILCNESGISHGEMLEDYKRIALEGTRKEIEETVKRHFIYPIN